MYFDLKENIRKRERVGAEFITPIDTSSSQSIYTYLL